MPLPACMVTLRARFSKSFLRSLRLRIYGAVDKISPVRLISPPPPAYPPLASLRQNDIIGGEKPSLEGAAMEYLTVRETAQKWGLAPRTVQQLCIAGRIPGAQKFGNSWAIPADAEKPRDPRSGRKQAKPPASNLLDSAGLMPLMNTPFQPGTCMAAVRAMEAGPQRDIAWAEYYYFTGQPEKAARAAGAFVAATSAVLLHRCTQHQGYDVSIGEDTNILSYTDAFEVSEYAVAALQWACGAGIISGTGDGSTLTPQGEATRAQAATVLMRFCEQDH